VRCCSPSLSLIYLPSPRAERLRLEYTSSGPRNLSSWRASAEPTLWPTIPRLRGSCMPF
jgi:hypothetical protein